MKNLSSLILIITFITFCNQFCFSQNTKWILGTGLLDKTFSVNIPRNDLLRFFEVDTKTFDYQERKLGTSVKNIISSGTNEAIHTAIDSIGNVAFYVFANPSDGYTASSIDKIYFIAQDKTSKLDEVFYSFDSDGLGAASVKDFQLFEDEFNKGFYHFFYKNSCINNRLPNDIYYIYINEKNKSIVSTKKIASGNLNEAMATSKLNCYGERRLYFTSLLNDKIEIYSILISENGIGSPQLEYSVEDNGLKTGGQGDLEISPDGKTLAFANFVINTKINDVILLDIDINTGKLSNNRHITLHDNGVAFALCFSPNSKRIFVTQAGASILSSKLYNISIPSVNYLSSFNDEEIIPISNYGSLELTLSNMLVIGKNYNDKIYAITNPDTTPSNTIFKDNTTFPSDIGVSPNFPDQILGVNTNISNLNIAIISNDSICVGDTIDFSISPPTNNTVNWFLDNKLISSTYTAKFILKQNSTITAQITKPDGCISIISKDIKVVNYLDPGFEINFEECSRLTTITNLTEGGNFSVLDKDSSFLNLIENKIVKLDSGEYLIKHEIGKNACKSESYKSISIPGINRLSEPIFANGISPLSETINAYFCPGKNENILEEDYELKIYDRWGNLIFKSNNRLDCWDGTLNGKTCENGVYVYLIKYKSDNCINEVKIKTGDIIIVK